MWDPHPGIRTYTSIRKVLYQGKHGGSGVECLHPIILLKHKSICESTRDDGDSVVSWGTT